MTGFRRRIYASPFQFGRDLWRVAQSLRPVIALSSRAGIPSGLRERIMLVVTGVNRCRHCAHGHQFLAQMAGISKAEIAALLNLDLANCPEGEIPALLFSIHWAESDGLPGAAAMTALEAAYGLAFARQIEAAALLISVGNRIGNSFDFVLARISGGRFGLLAGER
ncbi:MAG: carboxymuconolactone decarboxylase family protein [Rhodocyclales bacterium]|nr:carboxymuconolactone decarboxylase family protein [Rhodocyclales bacterium]